MSDLGWTAFLTAFSRSLEAREPVPLFVDPLAAEFVAAHRRAEVDAGNAQSEFGAVLSAERQSELWRTFVPYINLRTSFLDRAIEFVVADCPQIVLLGAGLDSRAFRLGLPTSTRLFEVDRSPVLSYKAHALRRLDVTPTCMRVPVEANLLADSLADKLVVAGFDPAVPTAWVVEGLLEYLTAEQADALLAELSGLSATGSHLLSEYFGRRWTDPDVRLDTFDITDRLVWHEIKAAFSYGPVDRAPADWLSSGGWTPEMVTSAAAWGAAAGRVLPATLAGPGAVPIWFFDGLMKP